MKLKVVNYILFNAGYAVAIYTALFASHSKFVKDVAFYVTILLVALAWFTVLMTWTIYMISDLHDNPKKMSKRMEAMSSSVPGWVDVLFDLFITVMFMCGGWTITGWLYFSHTVALRLCDIFIKATSRKHQQDNEIN